MRCIERGVMPSIRPQPLWTGIPGQFCDLKHRLASSPRWPLALVDECWVCTDHVTATVSQGYAGWVSLAQLAMHAMDTLGSSCTDAGIAWQQLGAV